MAEVITTAERIDPEDHPSDLAARAQYYLSLASWIASARGFIDQIEMLRSLPRFNEVCELHGLRHCTDWTEEQEGEGLQYLHLDIGHLFDRAVREAMRRPAEKVVET